MMTGMIIGPASTESLTRVSPVTAPTSGISPSIDIALPFKRIAMSTVHGYR
jgi:hypothetical protein